MNNSSERQVVVAWRTMVGFCYIA